MNTHPLSVHTNGNDHFHPNTLILGLLEGQNLAQQVQILSLNCNLVNFEICPISVHTEFEYFFREWSENTIFSHFVATTGPKCGPCGPKANSF